MPDGDSVALLYEDLGNGAAYRGRDLDNGLVGFELDDGLVFDECVADGDEDADDVAVLNVFAQVGQCKFYRHSVGNLFRASLSECHRYKTGIAYR